MKALHNVLLQKYASKLTPVHCAEQTIAQLHRYFEDVVLENQLAALIVEGLPQVAERSLREIKRVHHIGRVARHAFFFVTPQDALNRVPLRGAEGDRECVLIRRPLKQNAEERFLIIADARFSAVLASVRTPRDEATAPLGDSVVWTFEHDIVLFAIDFLLARTRTESPEQAAPFIQTVRTAIPKEASSQWKRAANYLSAAKTQLTVSVATELARLLQEQAGREVAVNRIANAIRSSFDIKHILETTVHEVGRALNAQCCALRVLNEGAAPPFTYFYFRKGAEGEVDQTELANDLAAYQTYLSRSKESIVYDEREMKVVVRQRRNSLAVVTLVYQKRFMGILLVRAEDGSREWQDTEKLLLSTVAGQVTVAVVQARLVAQLQQQALTDGLTSCLNRRSFEMQLEHDIQLSMRTRQPVSLIMIDLDHFKRVNDTYGHDAGDLVLRTLADLLRKELRGMDTASRYGGEEFAVILPQVGIEDAELVAERLRVGIEKTNFAGVGRVTASFGVATFPRHATSREQLVTTADRALYQAKHSGRNRVCTYGSTTPPADPQLPEEPAVNATSITGA